MNTNLENNIENTIIQSLVTNPIYFSNAFTFLKADHFSSIENQEIFKQIKKYYNNYQTPPKPKEIGLSLKDIKPSSLQETTIEHFKQVIKADQISNLEFLKQTSEQFVREQEYKKAIIAGAEALQNGKDLSPSYAALGEALKINFDSDLGLDYTDLERRLEYYKRKSLDGIKTGLPSIDEILDGGFKPKTLNVIASKSFGGKSAFMAHCASNALLSGKNILFLTLEMSEEETAKRIDANVLNIDINTFRTTPIEVFTKAYDSVKKALGFLSIKEYGAGTFDVMQLESLMQEVYAKKGFYPDVIFIDYLTLMKSTRVSSSSTNSYTLFKFVAEELHQFAKKYSVAVVTAAQLNRSGYDSGTEVGLQHVSDSLGVAQTADVFFSIIRSKEMDELSQVLITFQKNRNSGRMDSVIVGSQHNYMRYHDLGGNNIIKNENPVDLDVVLQNFDGKNTDIFDSFGGLDALGL